MKYAAQWTTMQCGKRKFIHHWQPASEPQAAVCIVHGLGEHGGRYHRLAEDFTQAGLVVFAFDQQGHGQSPERRGCIASYASLLDDIGSFQRWVRSQVPHLSLVLFGHSMGGNLVINSVLREYAQPAGVIASSPMIEAANPPGPLFVRMARTMMWLAPNFRLRSTVIPERIMSDPEEQQAVKEDKLFHSQLSLRLGAGLLDSGRWALRHAAKLQTAMLLSHGTCDRLTSPAASAEFARRAGALCQLAILEGQLHDPFRDVERAVVIARHVAFIRQLAPGQGGANDH